jgi:hypothetical protein
MTANAKRWIAFIAMIAGFTGLHFACWWNVQTLGLWLFLSIPIAAPFVPGFLLSTEPDIVFCVVGVINSLFWGVSLAVFVLRMEHKYWLACQRDCVPYSLSAQYSGRKTRCNDSA